MSRCTSRQAKPRYEAVAGAAGLPAEVEAGWPERQQVGQPAFHPLAVFEAIAVGMAWILASASPKAAQAQTSSNAFQCQRHRQSSRVGWSKTKGRCIPQMTNLGNLTVIAKMRSASSWASSSLLLASLPHSQRYTCGLAEDKAMHGTGSKH